MNVAGMTDIPEHLAYFDELFSDMLEDGLSEDEVTARLGDPRLLVRTLLQEEKGERAPENSPRQTTEESSPFGQDAKTSFAAFGSRLFQNITDRLNRFTEPAAGYTEELSEEGLNSLDIVWDLGDVEIRAENRQGILLKQSRETKGAPPEYQCRDGLLSIRCRKNMVSFGRGQNLTLILPLTLAQRLALCRIRTVSGDVSLEEMHCGTLQIKSVSGDVETARVQAKEAFLSSVSGDAELELWTEKLCIGTVSGDVRFRGKAVQLSLQTKSGDADLIFETCPESAEAQSVSGDLELALPAGSRFRFLPHTVSGDIRLRGLGADASARPLLSVRTVSGDILVRAE